MIWLKWINIYWCQCALHRYTFSSEYKTQKLPDTCTEKMKDIVISSLMTWRGDLCFYSCKSNPKMSDCLKDQKHICVSCTRGCPQPQIWTCNWKEMPGRTEGYPALAAAGARHVFWVTHGIPAKGLKVESAQQTEKPQEPQCLPAALTVQAVTPQQGQETGRPFGCLPTHPGRDPSPQPQTSRPHLAGVNGKQPLTVRWHWRRRLYIGVCSEIVCTFGGQVKGTKMKVSTLLGGNGEACKPVWVRPSGKPRGCSLSGRSPHFSRSLVGVGRFFSTGGSPRANSSAQASRMTGAATGLCHPCRLPTSPTPTALPFPIALWPPLGMTTHLLSTSRQSISQKFPFHKFPVFIVSLVSGVSLNWQHGPHRVLIKETFTNSFPAILVKNSRTRNINPCLVFISIMLMQW